MATEQFVNPKIIELFVNVLPVCKVTHWFLVLRLDVQLASNALTMRNVTILRPRLLEKTVSHCAGKILVPGALLVQQVITEKYVLVTTLFKETAIYHVQNVRSSKYLLIQDYKKFEFIYYI